MNRKNLLVVFIILILILILFLVKKIFLFSENNVSLNSNSQVNNIIEKPGLIKINNLKENQLIKSPLELRGEARGFWFFEASFPIRLLDGNGKEMAVTIAQAQGEWMTEDFVPFSTRLEFTVPATDFGTLVFEKDNPSGLPENADELRVRVRFR